MFQNYIIHPTGSAPSSIPWICWWAIMVSINIYHSYGRTAHCHPLEKLFFHNCGIHWLTTLRGHKANLLQGKGLLFDRRNEEEQNYIQYNWPPQYFSCLNHSYYILLTEYNVTVIWAYFLLRVRQYYCTLYLVHGILKLWISYPIV